MNLDLMQYQQKPHPFPEEEMLPVPFIRDFKVNCDGRYKKEKKKKTYVNNFSLPIQKQIFINTAYICLSKIK